MHLYPGKIGYQLFLFVVGCNFFNRIETEIIFGPSNKADLVRIGLYVQHRFIVSKIVKKTTASRKTLAFDTCLGGRLTIRKQFTSIETKIHKEWLAKS